jgi:hypothetical protein
MFIGALGHFMGPFTTAEGDLKAKESVSAFLAISPVSGVPRQR